MHSKTHLNKARSSTISDWVWKTERIDALQLIKTELDLGWLS